MRICSMCYSKLQVPKFGLQSPLRFAYFWRTVTTTTTSQSPIKCFRSIEYSDAQAKILDDKVLMHPLKVFAMDVETTGFCRKRGRIIEIALRDLEGGKNSCFQTLVNPEQDIPNSYIHGITTDMVSHSGVPRMMELIPILGEYIKSRHVPGGHVILAAHNARRFDVPFLLEEFIRCSFDIPPDLMFLDTLALARELRKLYGPKTPSKISLHGLCEFYRIPLEGSNHRAMSDVHLLSSILAKMTFDLKVTATDLLQRCFQASVCITSRRT